MSRRLQQYYRSRRAMAEAGHDPEGFSRSTVLYGKALAAERAELFRLHRLGVVSDENFQILQEELDCAELAASAPSDRALLEG